MRVVVTGASGFVGGAVARAAVRAGWDVITTSRRPADVPGARHVTWDLTQAPPPDAAHALAGTEVVVHAAAWVGDGGARDRVRAVTVGGTRAALDWTGAARLVHVSTASVYDPRRPSVLVREDEAPVERYLDPYAEAKADAERLVLARAGARDVVVLRPHAVYGPGDTTLLPRVLGSVRGGRLPLPGGGRVRQHLTAVGTLVDAVLAAATVPLERGRPVVANVADAEPVLLRDALTELLARRGLDVRVVGVPAAVALALAATGEAAHRLPGVPAPRLTRYGLSHLLHERTYDLTTLRTTLGVLPGPTSFAGAADW